MSIQLLLYFGTLAFIGVGAFTLFIVISMRRDQKVSQKRQKQHKPTISGAYRMQVILPEAGKPLIWVVNGFAYKHPNEIEDSDEISALTEFLAKLQDSSPNTIISLPSSASEEVNPVTEKPVIPPLADDLPQDDSPTVPKTLPSPPSLSYEEQMQQPFLERLRASFFGASAPTSPQVSMTASPFKPSPSIPKLAELEEIVHKQLGHIPSAPIISIRTAHHGLLEIMIDDQLYERIDDIPDDTIRQVMHKSVKIWESKM